jgi:aspartate racemase
MRTIGVLGGMGPAAAADFYVRIVAAHGALRDQDHPPCILYSATQVPDRTAFLLGGGADPTPELVAAAGLIEAAGADFIAIPCNSAHAFLSSIRAGVAIPVLDMTRLASRAVARVMPRARRVGILATSGTVSTGLYEEPLRDDGLEPVYPSAELQESVMAAISAVKAGGGSRGGEASAAGSSDPRLLEAARELGDRGAECLIMACTEVPLAMSIGDSPVVAIDGNQTLVDTTLGLAVGRLEFEDVAYAVR